jgi:hypothetical protein
VHSDGDRTTIDGHTKSGRPITDQDIESLAAEAEAGYDVETLIARRNKRGRPTLGNAPSSVESVRLDRELRRHLLDCAEAEGTTTSELIREARRRYLQAARRAHTIGWRIARHVSHAR